MIHLVQIILGWIINFDKSDLIPTQEIEFLGYEFNLRVGLVLPTKNKFDCLLENTVSMLEDSHTSPRKLMSLIGSMASMEKMISENYWRYPQSLDIPVPVSQLLKNHLQWWTRIGSPLHQEHNLLITDASPKRLGCSPKAEHSQWFVESASHKYSRANSNVSTFKLIRKSASESKSADFHRQLFSGCLSE